MVKEADSKKWRSGMIKDDFDYYTAHQDKIVDGHIDEFVVIKDARVAGYYKHEDDAFEAMKSHDLGTFLIKQCRPRGTDIITYYNNQVSFA
jgi:hypothetical protein